MDCDHSSQPDHAACDGNLVNKNRRMSVRKERIRPVCYKTGRIRFSIFHKWCSGVFLTVQLLK